MRTKPGCYVKYAFQLFAKICVSRYPVKSTSIDHPFSQPSRHRIINAMIHMGIIQYSAHDSKKLVLDEKGVELAEEIGDYFDNSNF